MPELLPPIHPGHYVKKDIIPEGMSVTEAAKLLGIGRPALSNFLNGNANLSKTMATRLEKAFGANKNSLLDMQQTYDSFKNLDHEKRIVVRSYTKHFLSIKAKDIEIWADKNIEARSHLAAFLRRLANSTGSQILKIDFPAYDNSQRHGWDGYIEAENATPWVPDGPSGWEFGCNQDPSSKANHDYTSRTKSVSKSERENTVFIFATPRNWNGKNVWAEEKRQKNEWKDIRAYDASDLEQWLEQSVSGQVWMAGQLGIQQEGCQTLDEYWRFWSETSTPPISPKIFDSTLITYRKKLTDWLSNTNEDLLIVTASSKDEALAFIACAAYNTPDLECLAEQGVIVSSADAIKKLAASSSNFIPITNTNEAEIELARLNQDQRAIIIAERNIVGLEPHITVELPSSECFRSALEDMGLNSDDVERQSNLSGNSPTILRRNLSSLPALKAPKWASSSERRIQMIPFVFAGTWKVSQPGDQEIIRVLFDTEYSDVEKIVADLVSMDDSPIWSEGLFRGVVSKLDCLNAVANHITVDDLQNFLLVAEIVLGEDDPALDLEKDQRWAAGIYDKVRDHSDVIRDSICETLILISIHGNGLFGQRLNFDASASVAALIRRLLSDHPPRVWQSQQNKLPQYAEAAPSTFLDIVESEIVKSEPAYSILFEPVDGNFMTSRCERTGMLWALELLAWHPARLARVVRVLGKLCAFELNDNWGNKPISSLNDILLSWRPHTAASLAQRIEVLELLCSEFPDAGWDVCMSHLKPGSSVTSGTYRPLFRNDASGSGQEPTHQDHFEFLRKCREIALSWPHHTHRTLSDLIDCMSEMDVAEKQTVTETIKTWLATSPADNEIIQLRENVRTKTLTYRALRRHKKGSPNFANGKEIFDLLEPADTVLKHQWLFAKSWVDFSADDLVEEEIDFKDRDQKLTEQRVFALQEVMETKGEKGLFELCLSGQGGFNIGFLLGREIMGSDQLISFSKSCLMFDENPENRQIEQCLSGILRQFNDTESHSFRLKLIDQFTDTESALKFKIKILKNAAFDRTTWKDAENLGKPVSQEYWNQVIATWGDFSDEDINFLVAKLVEVRRPKAAFDVAHLDPDRIETKTLINLLTEIGTNTAETAPNYQFSGYDVESALESLSNRSDSDQITLSRLEFFYINALTPTTKYTFPNLSQELAESPILYMQMIALCFKRDDDGKDPVEWALPTDPEIAKSQAKNAYSALEYACKIPGTKDNGEIDVDVLRNWIVSVRKLAKENRREAITDQKIGHILSSSKSGSDGLWPNNAVRQVFDELQSIEVSIGMEIGVYNSDGAHFHTIDSERERSLVEKYSTYADTLMNEFPFTSRMLRNIADYYKRDAERWDSDARVRQRTRR